jgi:hypothetical protein
VVKFIAPVAGFFLAMFLHYAWNLTVLTATQFPIVYFYFYFVFMLPAFIGALVLIVFQLGREGGDHWGATAPRGAIRGINCRGTNAHCDGER